MTQLSKLKTMKDAEIRKWLRKVGRENAEMLAKALTAADAETQECVFRNMSRKAKSVLKEDIRKFKDRGVAGPDIEQSAGMLEKWM